MDLGIQESRGSRAARVAWLAAIVVVSAALGMLVDWRAPGLALYTRDWLMRARGPLPAPDDIAIVALDDASMARFGRFPWPRGLMAKALDRIAAAEPRAIALDVLYADATTAGDDEALAQAIAHAGNVVAAAQLVHDPVSGHAAWLLPLPAVAQAAAAVGHVNVATESEGVARQLLLTAADDAGRPIRSMAVEAVRIAERVPEQGVEEGPRGLLLGSRVIPAEEPGPALAGGARVLRAGRMALDYIGPAGSYRARTYSFAEVLDGRAPAAAFRGKYVLIGATAASLGDRLASPFQHTAGAGGDQHGSLMPGVEVLANALNTILRGRFYSEPTDGAVFLLAALAAAVTLGLLGAAQGHHETARQIAVLAGLAGGIVGVSYLAFSRWLVYPPVIPGLVSFASAGVLGLLDRSLAASARLDAAIASLASAGDLLDPAPAGVPEAIAGLAGATAAALFAAGGAGKYRLQASHGTLPAVPRGDVSLAKLQAVMGGGKSGETRALSFQAPDGLLLLVRPAHTAPDTLRLCTAMAAGALAAWEGAEPARGSWWRPPRGLEWKARSVARLNARLLARARFVGSALRSVEDGLLVAGPDARIRFVNRRAAAIFGTTEQALLGRDLLARLAEVEGAAIHRQELLVRVLVEGGAVEREIAIPGARTRHYMLRLAAVGDSGRAALGIVASLSDITRQRELQQTKNDVVALVSHEMRTPLTAIQGMSELLAQYDLDAGRRQELNAAINDEVKRLTRMIDEYLNITRLESGKTAVRLAPVRVEALLERVALLLEPVASQRGIRLARRWDAALPAILADQDLLARAVTNLVSNAIKYSPPGTEVTIFATCPSGGVSIEVTDQGYGIPPSDLERIFEKFYRVPRVQDADVPGTGLGLALVREIAGLHGGTVTVSSSVGKGSVFTLQLPRPATET